MQRFETHFNVRHAGSRGADCDLKHIVTASRDLNFAIAVLFGDREDHLINGSGGPAKLFTFNARDDFVFYGLVTVIVAAVRTLNNGNLL